VRPFLLPAHYLSAIKKRAQENAVTTRQRNMGAVTGASMGAKGIANSEEDYIYGQLGIILRLCTAFIVL
jgi:hypothetical protein